MRIRTPLACAALLGVAALSAPVAGDTIDIDLSGWQSFGDFTDGLNSSTLVNIGADSEITGVEWIDLEFSTENGSWISELVLSVNHSANSGAAGTFWDYNPGEGTNSSGTYGPASGSFPDPSPLFNSGPFTVDADGGVFVTVYENFDDPIGDPNAPDLVDATITAGTLRITYSPVPEPTSMALLGLGGLAMLRRRR